MKNCSPASCLPESTSHSRNSARNFPSAITDSANDQRLCIDRPPVLEARRASDVESLLDERSLDRSAGTAPTICRSFATTSEISRADFASIEPSPAKSGMAIGIGWMLPCVMLSSTTACAGVEAAARRSERAEQESSDSPGTSRASERSEVGSWRRIVHAMSAANRCHTSRLGSKLRIMSRHTAYFSLGSS